MRRPMSAPMRRPASRSSSAAIARWARRITGQGAIFWVFQILRDYAHTLKAGKHRHVPDLPRLMAILDDLEAAQVPLPIVFGHHDLLPTNFMDDGHAALADRLGVWRLRHRHVRPRQHRVEQFLR